MTNRKPCQCGSNCHNACESTHCCDCGAPMVGPVEIELRTLATRPSIETIFGATDDAYRCYFDAWVSLGNLQEHMQSDEYWPDIMSEAIEAASELGI